MSKTKNRSRVLALVLMLALVLAILPMGAMATSNVSTYNNIEIQFGDPNYPATWPENLMSLVSVNGSTTNYDAVYDVNGSSDYYPSILSLYAFYSSNTNLTLTSSDNTKIQFVTYNQYGTEIVDSDGIINYTQNSNWNPDANGGQGGMVSSNLYAIKIIDEGSITIATANNQYTVTINFSAPSGVAAPLGSTPKSVESYLPVGQYATGSGWGSASGKFVNAFNSTGVSLGALGGYIEFDFDNPSTTTIVEGITNDPRNPYGVDFVVYGNAFHNNPEAGAVQVSETGDVWYELAGSRYYDGGFSFNTTNASNTSKYSNVYTGSLRKTSVVYELKSSGIDVTLESYGPYPFTTATTWWPTTSEYPEFSANTYPTSGNSHAHGDISVAYGGSATGSTITFGGVTAVPDSNLNAFYAFGYADVTPNGTISHYGDAVNPYTPYTNGKVGGDGFDLEWAVDIDTGMPVNVTGKTFRYVRVYTAVLDNGTFGETSTEVCGIFTAYLTETEEALDATEGVGRTNAPSIYVNNSGYSLADYAAAGYAAVTSIGTVTIYYASALVSTNTTITATGASGTNIFVNNDIGSHVVVGGENMVRVIAQLGNAAPSITLIIF